MLNTKAQSRARATYVSDVSVALILSASDSVAAPASPIRLLNRLQRGGVRDARGETRRHKAGHRRLTRATSASRCS
jgi:hypothetical protein